MASRNLNATDLCECAFYPRRLPRQPARNRLGRGCPGIYCRGDAWTRWCYWWRTWRRSWSGGVSPPPALQRFLVKRNERTSANSPLSFRAKARVKSSPRCFDKSCRPQRLPAASPASLAAPCVLPCPRSAENSRMGVGIFLNHCRRCINLDVNRPVAVDFVKKHPAKFPATGNRPARSLRSFHTINGSRFLHPSTRYALMPATISASSDERMSSMRRLPAGWTTSSSRRCPMRTNRKAATAISARPTRTRASPS
jgi:hypothetical protein